MPSMRISTYNVPAPDDRWWSVWSSRWNENWEGKPKYSEKTYPSATLSTTNPTWSDLGRRGGKPATNCLSYGTAFENAVTTNENYDLKRSIYSKSCKGRVCENGTLISDMGSSLFRIGNILQGGSNMTGEGTEWAGRAIEKKKYN
jgi:hypothetical protein